MAWRAWLTLSVWLCAASVQAHSLSLAVLTLKEIAPGEFVASWEQTLGGRAVAGKDGVHLLLKPQFPAQCRFEPPRLRCGSPGLRGRMGFAGLAEQSTTGLIHVDWRSGGRQSFNFTASQPEVQVAPPDSSRAPRSSIRSLEFVRVGVEHIWLGWDHLLFVLGLFWLVRAPRLLVQTITAFTLAHSLTLAAATLGLRWVPAAPVEAVIALSIAFVAVELARHAKEGSPSFTAQRPWLVAFAFGLLHGFGFANALAQIELAPADIPAALFYFNVGVELGQLAFVAVLLLARTGLRRFRESSRDRAAVLGYYAMGTLAMYWFFERVTAF